MYSEAKLTSKVLLVKGYIGRLFERMVGGQVSEAI